MTGRLVPSGVHNIKWILDKEDRVIGAIHGTTFFSRMDIRRSPHVAHHLHMFLKKQQRDRNDS